MAGINLSRVLLGGLVAAVVAGVCGYLLRLAFAEEMTASLTRLGLSEPAGATVGILMALGLVYGIVTIWFYAAVRPRFGAGVGTAVIVAVALWVMVSLLMTIQWTKIFENSTDYSIQNTTRQALFLPTSREAKYKAKQAIDSFFVRFGDMLQAGVVYVGVQVALSVRGFAIVNLILIGVWVLIVVGIRHEHKKMTGSETMDRAA